MLKGEISKEPIALVPNYKFTSFLVPSAPRYGPKSPHKPFCKLGT